MLLASSFLTKFLIFLFSKYQLHSDDFSAQERSGLVHNRKAEEESSDALSAHNFCPAAVFAVSRWKQTQSLL